MDTKLVRTAVGGLRRMVGRCAAGWLIATMALLGLTVSHVPAASAASSSGGSISRSEIVDRAFSWWQDRPQYNKGASHQNPYGTYRTDCSGFVSLAWHLPSSMTTSTLPSVSTKLASRSALAPGDILLTSGHVIMFVNWTTQDNGQRRYADLVAMANTTDDMKFYGNVDVLNASWLSGYSPYRYNNAAWATNRLVNASFERSTWTWGKGASANIGFATYRSSSAVSGVSIGATSTSTTSGASIAQVSATSPKAGTSYTYSVYVRASSGTKKGTIAVWALGGTSESASTSFTVGTSWKKLSVTLPVKKTGHAAMKAELYLGSTGPDYYLDSASLTKTA